MRQLLQRCTCRRRLCVFAGISETASVNTYGRERWELLHKSMSCVLIYNVSHHDGRAARGHARVFADKESALARACAILAEHPGSEAWLEQNERIVMSAREVARWCESRRT